MRVIIGNGKILFLTKSALVATLVANLATPRIADAANCLIPGFDMAAFGDTGISMGNGNTDSYNSLVGPYATSQCTSTANCVGGVATNATASGGINLGPNASVKGQCQIGAGAPTGNITPNSSKCATTTVQPAAVTLSVPTIPATPVPTALGAISGNYTFPAAGGSFTMTSLTLAGNSALTVPAGLTAPIIVYLTGSGNVISMSGNGAVNNTTSLPTNLIFMCTSASAQTISLSGNGLAFFAVYCPKANITIAGNGAIYGAVVGKSVTFNGNNGYVHYDEALGLTTSSAISCAATEISRSSPVIATILGDEVIVQGTYEYPFSTLTQVTAAADLTAFRFPYIQGHMRASKLSQFNTTTTTVFTGRTGSNEIFDSKTLIPSASYAPCAMFDGTCRTVFTTIAGGDNPVRTHLSSANVSTIGPLMSAGITLTSAQQGTLMTRILMGDDSSGTFKPKLGGIDRSTAAVIPFSLVAGEARPTMIYAGGTDGMLHAFCGDNVSPCTVGKELWAYIPRVLLGDLRKNSAIIDGSPRVVDMFGDFDADGIKTFSTILLFQTGTGVRAADKTPAVYALDVTDPRDPKVLWERTMTSVAGTAGTFQLGQGQVIAAGQVLIGGAVKNAAFVQTNNGAGLKDASGTAGAGTSGSVVTAINVETGDDLWAAHTYAYPSPHVAPRTVGDAAVPKTAVPGGVVGFDSTNTGTITELVFGTIYGDLWVLDASTGLSKFGTGPLFRLTGNFKPIGAVPTIFATSGSAYAVAATGAYWDRSGSVWNTAATQHLFAVKIKTTTTGFPFSELTTPSASAMKFAYSFSGGQKASAQVLVVGEELLYTTDLNDINALSYGTSTAAGAAYKTNLAGSQTGSDTTVVTGVGSLASSGTGIYASGGKGSEQLSFTAASTTGESVNSSQAPKVTRRLWLRTL